MNQVYYFMKEIIVRGYNLSKQVLHGMTAEQYLDLIEFQDFKCHLSGIEFVYSEEKMKFMDINGKAPPIDHDHSTGFIRGILSEKVNWLEKSFDSSCRVTDSIYKTFDLKINSSRKIPDE